MKFYNKYSHIQEKKCRWNTHAASILELHVLRSCVLYTFLTRLNWHFRIPIEYNYLKSYIMMVS